MMVSWTSSNVLLVVLDRTVNSPVNHVPMVLAVTPPTACVLPGGRGLPVPSHARLDSTAADVRLLVSVRMAGNVIT